MTHSLSVTAAESPPAMYRRATLAMVVSSTSMNVGTRTATAINQGPKRGPEVRGRRSEVMRVSADRRALLCKHRGVASTLVGRRMSVAAILRDRGGRRRLFCRRVRRFPGGSHRRLGQLYLRLQHLAGVRPRRLLAIINVRHDREADK